jgi:hypothetical protein
MIKHHEVLDYIKLASVTLLQDILQDCIVELNKRVESATTTLIEEQNKRKLLEFQVSQLEESYKSFTFDPHEK